MKERPILFSGAMIRAIMAGQKTQMRRVIKTQPEVTEQRLREMGAWKDGFTLSQHVDTAWQHGFIDVDCPYGQPGDRLWVRESWSTDSTLDAKPPSSFKAWPIRYVADGKIIKHGSFFGNADGKTRPGIHMPRWASRILLEVVSVRVERLQSISEADAEAEGIDFLRHVQDADETLTARDLYECLWDGINGAGSWEANPWVWVVEFKRIETTP